MTTTTPPRLPNAEIYVQDFEGNWQEVARRDATVPPGVCVDVIETGSGIPEKAIQVTTKLAQDPSLMPDFARHRYRSDGVNVIEHFPSHLPDATVNVDIGPIEFGRWLVTHGVCCHHHGDEQFRQRYAILADSIPPELPT